MPRSAAKSSMVTPRKPWAKKCRRAAAMIRCEIGLAGVESFIARIGLLAALAYITEETRLVFRVSNVNVNRLVWQPTGKNIPAPPGFGVSKWRAGSRFPPSTRSSAFLGLSADLPLEAAVLGAEERSAVQDFFLKLFEIEINHRGDEQGDELGHNQAADDDQTERAARRAVGAEAERDRNCAEHRRERGHEDRPEPVHARVVDRLLGRFAVIDALQREVDDHDAVLLDNAHQHEHTDEGVERGLLAE